MNRISRTSLALAVAASTAAAQAPSWTLTGYKSDSRLGFSVACIGDYNGNGTDDVLIGEPGDFGGSFVTRGGSVSVRDGDGSCITLFYGQQPHRQMGLSVAGIPDLDGDGLDEILIGSAGYDQQSGNRYRGRVSVYMGGSDGGGQGGCGGSSWVQPALTIDLGLFSVLNGDQFGKTVASIGDVDGDGLADFAVGANQGNLTQTPGAYTGFVKVYSGASVLTGVVTEIYTLDGVDPWSLFGESICSVGDLTGDGVADLAVGAPYEDVGSDGFSGIARFYSGSDGGFLFQINGGNGHRLGQAICNLGDMDGDGRSEVAIGAPGDRNGPGQGMNGSVTIYSGASLAAMAAGAGVAPIKLKVFGDDVTDGQNVLGGSFGWSIANAADIDGDGVNDLLVGAPSSHLWDPDSQLFGNWPGHIDAVDTGMCWLLSGASGAPIKSYFADNPADADSFGACVAAGRDLDSDGRADLVVAAPWTDASQADQGRVYVYSGRTEFGYTYGVGTPNSTGASSSLVATGSQSVSLNQLSIRATGLPANVMGLLAMSDVQTAGAPIGNGLLYLGGAQIYRLTVVNAGPNGEVTVPVDFGAIPPSVLGLTRWNFQFWHRDAGGTFNFSDALTIGLY